MNYEKSISSNPYRFKKSLPNQLTGNQNRHLNTLTGFVYGIIQSRQVKLASVAGELPNMGKEESRVMQLRRLLSNPALDYNVYFMPMIMMILMSLGDQPLVLMIDGSVSGRGCVTLMVSFLYRGRALPLVWVTRTGKKGHFPESMHVDLIKAVYELVPLGKEVICLGDGEFDGTDWLATLEQFGWHFVCRTAKDSLFYEEGEAFAIQDICPAKGDCTGIENLQFTKACYGPVTGIAWWGRDYQEPIYLVSNFLLPEEACRWYRKRFRIETMFSDFKGRGFQLQKSGLRDPAKVSRLLIAVALAYIWVVYFGVYAMETGWHKIIHRTERCDLSLFELGKRLLKRFQTNEIPIPSFSFVDGVQVLQD